MILGEMKANEIDLILSNNKANVFEKEAFFFGMVDDSCIFRKSFGMLRSVV